MGTSIRCGIETGDGSRSGVIGVYLTSSRDSNDLTVACHKIIDGIASINIEKPINVNVLSFKIERIPESCGVNRNELFQSIASIAGREAAPAPLQTPSPPPETGNLSGWAAVGILGTGAYKDVNFDLADGRPVARPPVQGTVLRSRWQVYVRPGAADWSKVNGILRPGECFVVDSSKRLDAKGRDQIWVSGHRDECPAS